MTQAQASPTLPAIASRSTAAKLFYPAAAGAMIVLAFIGFSDFYLRGLAYPSRPIGPPIRAVVIAHGVLMSAWLILLFLQPALIRAGKRKLHMKLGKLGAVLAALVTISGVLVAVRSTQAAPPETIIWGLEPKPFMAIPFLVVVIYGCFTAAAFVNTHKPPLHRSLMIAGTLAAMSAPISRIDPLNNLYLGTALETLTGPFLFTIALGALLLAARTALSRTLDRPLALALLIMTAALLAIVQIAPTQTWHTIATALVG